MIDVKTWDSLTFGDLIMQVCRDIDCLYMRLSVMGTVVVGWLNKNVPNTDDCSNKTGWLSYIFNIDLFS